MRFSIVIADPLKMLTKGIRVRTLISTALLIAYIGVSLLLFAQWVNPSLDGRTDQHIGADSTTYLYFAHSLRSGNVDPWVITSLASFPNTLWVPVLLAVALKSTFAMVVANYAMFWLSFLLLKKSFSFSARMFVGLLLLNATTTISLLTVNKEIVDLLAIALFFFGLRRQNNRALIVALFLAFFNRYEIFIVMMLFLFAKSRLNPWARRRVLTLAAVTLFLGVMLPLFASNTMLAKHVEEASGGGIVTWLDSLEMHYLYGFAVIPKIAENFFGELVNVSKWSTSYGSSDIANSYILLSNNLANAVVLVILASKRRFSVQSEIMYFTMLGCIVMATSLVIQPRYFYFAYVLLSLRAAQTEPREATTVAIRHTQDTYGTHFSPDDNEAAFG